VVKAGLTFKAIQKEASGLWAWEKKRREQKNAQALFVASKRKKAKSAVGRNCGGNGLKE